jgi:hypothetical protein
MVKVAILQPGYLPWLGFFDLMSQVDTFIILDDVQYTVRDWRSRNRIKTPDGAIWLTVPVKAKGAREKLIKEVNIESSRPWQKKHLKTLELFYKKSLYFDVIIELMRDIYRRNYTFLIDVDMAFILKIREYLSLKSEILFSSDLPSKGKRNEKLLSICEALNATHYLSGNAAKAYLRESVFADKGITVEWHDYRHPYYNQLWLKEGGFISFLSTIDLLFNHGPDSLSVLTGRRIISKPDWVTVRNADEL